MGVDRFMNMQQLKGTPYNEQWVKYKYKTIKHNNGTKTCKSEVYKWSDALTLMLLMANLRNTK